MLHFSCKTFAKFFLLNHTQVIAYVIAYTIISHTQDYEHPCTLQLMYSNEAYEVR